MWTPGLGLGRATEQELSQEPVCSRGAAVRWNRPLYSAGEQSRMNRWRGPCRLWSRGGAPAVTQTSRAELPTGPRLGLGGICPRTGGVAAEAHPHQASGSSCLNSLVRHQAPLAEVVPVGGQEQRPSPWGSQPCPEGPAAPTALVPKCRCCSSLFLTCRQPLEPTPTWAGPRVPMERSG